MPRRKLVPIDGSAPAFARLAEALVATHEAPGVEIPDAGAGRLRRLAPPIDGCAKRCGGGPQCAISVGSVIDRSTVRDAPPRTSSRARLCPKQPITSRLAETFAAIDSSISPALACPTAWSRSRAFTPCSWSQARTCAAPGRAWNGKIDPRRRLSRELGLLGKRVALSLGERFYERQYARLAAELGALTRPLPDQDTLARLARPYYNPLLRGGEGHLEVAKNIYYTSRGLCDMVLSLKPFGCMPSSQSDGVQSKVVSRFPDMTYVPIEVSGEGEIHAHSRAQMALADARTKARREFESALASTGRSLDEILRFAGERPYLRRPFYPVPRRPGVAGVAANYVLHVNDLMR